MWPQVRISTPSRLHFGLLRFRVKQGASYGGLGAMIDRPRYVVRLEVADRWSCEGLSGARAKQFAERALAAWAISPTAPAALRIVIESEIPPHSGLGGGTQLAMAVAAGVRALLGLPACRAAELASAVGRGRRSAVGSHGFQRGGLLWDEGRTANQSLGRLGRRVELPPEWRFLLIADVGQGLSGQAERDAFREAPAVSASTSAVLRRIAEDLVLPAAESGDVEAFGEAVYQYGRIAGGCFAKVQGGPYASAKIAASVDQLRTLGVPGVGQSSWGPTVFAVLPSQTAAESIVAQLRRQELGEGLRLQIAASDNRGAVVEIASREGRDQAELRRLRVSSAYNRP